MNQVPEILNEQQREILQTILERFIKDPEGVLINEFKLEYLKDREVINDFEQSQLLKKNNDQTKYRLSLVALFLINSELSKKIFIDIDLICDILRDHYKLNLNTPILINEIKNKLNFDKQYLVTCLNWLLDGVSMGRTTDMMSEDAEITPSEHLFDFSYYTEIPQQLLPSWFPEQFKRKSKTHGNTEINAVKREAVLGAALSVLANFPDQCKSQNGKVMGRKISKLIDEKSLLLFPQYDGEPPFQPDKITRIVNEYLKLPK